jgi:FAD:protein FMN transferase
MSTSIANELRSFKRVEKLMGNRFELTAVTGNETHAWECLEDAVNEIKRIEQLLTTFNDKSQTSAINAAAGLHPVRVDSEVFSLIKRANKISEITQGAFDLSYGSLDKRLWNFDQTMTALPGKEAAKKAVSLINYKNIILDENNKTVFLKNKGMRIGFGGIGKGYAAERAKASLIRNGIASGVVNASGDLAVWGTQPNTEPWTIGIAAPDGTLQPFSQMQLSNQAVATSGNYEKFVWINNKKYSHTIDPKTGYPVSGIKSVTIICPNAELADAMATPVMVMGIQTGLHLINQISNIECIIIDDDNRMYTSKNIKLV